MSDSGLSFLPTILTCHMIDDLEHTIWEKITNKKKTQDLRSSASTYMHKASSMWNPQWNKNNYKSTREPISLSPHPLTLTNNSLIHIIFKAISHLTNERLYIVRQRNSSITDYLVIAHIMYNLGAEGPLGTKSALMSNRIRGTIPTNPSISIILLKYYYS